MTRIVEVELWSTNGHHTQFVGLGPLATDEVAVDRAREKAGISGEEFTRGEVVSTERGR